MWKYCSLRNGLSDGKLKTGKIEDGVVGAYQKVEDAFVDSFLEKVEEEKLEEKK